MANEKEYYYAVVKKVKLNKLPDSFAVKYKSDIASGRMGGKLAEIPAFANLEELKVIPTRHMVIATLPPLGRLTDMGASLSRLEGDSDVEYITSVYREAQSGLRLVATDEITVRFKSSVSETDIEKFNKENGVEVIEKNRFVPNQYLLRVKNPKDTLMLANKYQESDLTEFAETNFITEVKKAALPNVRFINEEWYLHNTGQNGGLKGEDVGAAEAWEINKG